MNTTAAPPVSIEEQVRWAEGAVARTKNYYQKLAREGRTHPATAASEIRRAEAAVATLRSLAGTASAPPPSRVVQCRSCLAEIVWLRTAAGKSMPVDAVSVTPEDQVYEHGRHTSHFATCPQAERHRRDRAGDAE